MTAVAVVYGGSRQTARAAVGRAMGAMARRAAGRAVSIDRDWVQISASGRHAASAERRDVAAVIGDLRLVSSPSADAGAQNVLGRFLSRPDAWLADLAGEFAFILIDDRIRRLTAVRDPLGIRPLYYRYGADGVEIASELAALVRSGDRPDEGYLAEALTGDIVDTEGTPYAAIRRVPAAHALIVDATGARVTRYWEPEASVHAGRPDEHQARLAEAFDRAVRDAARGCDRVAVHVSGGLDSSSVLGSVMTAAECDVIAGGNVLPWPEADERQWMEATARRWSLDLVLASPPLDPPAHALDDIRTHRDLPDQPNGAPLFAALHERFRRGGADAVLTGFGGDQWWSGESAHMADLLRAGRIGELRTWRRAGPAMGDAEWSWQSFVRNGLRPLAPPALRAFVRTVRPTRAPAWISPSLAARVDLVDRLRRRPETSHAPSEAWRRLRWRLDSGEESLAFCRLDRMAVEHGIELRYPMYDRRLVELALATPDTARIGGGRNRVVLREAMRDRLAPEVYARTGKADLTPLLLDAARAPDVRPFASLRRLEAAGWIEPAAARAIVNRVDARDGDVALLFWSLIGVEAWLAEVFGAE